MQIEVENIETNKVRLKLEIGAEKVDQAFKEAAKKLSRTVKLSGFRPGKIPKNVLEKTLGQKAIAREAMEVLIPQAYTEAIRKKEIVPIDFPQFEGAELPEEGKPYSFVAVVETKPEVKLGSYRGLRLEKETITVSPLELEKALQEIREQRATLAPTDEPAREGHIVELELQGYQKGKKLSDFKGTSIAELGRQELLPEIEEALKGMQVGQKKRVLAKLPENYPLKSYRGQEIELEITLKECKEKLIPESDDLLAQSLGFDNVETMRKEVQKSLEYRLAQQEKDKALAALVRQATEQAEVFVPEVLVKRATERLIHQMDMNLRYYNLNVEDYIEKGQLKDPAKQQEVEAKAREKVKMDLVLEAIAKKEGICVTEEEFAREIILLSQKLKKEPKFVLEKLRENGEDREIEAQILRHKTMEFLLEQATIEMVPARSQGGKK